ncbi:MAG TPA: hypothetical protein VF586_12815 [Pyrinomonadaceae bacterium]|jgi:hypothetical protein
MADNVQPDAGERREESSSGLLLSVDPLQGANNYKLAGDDSSDKGGLLGDDSSDSDGSDSDALGGDDSDSDGSDAGGAGGSDADGSDSLLGGDDSGATDAADAGSIVPDGDGDSTDEQMNPLGIADTNVDGTTAARPAAGDGMDGGEDGS